MSNQGYELLLKKRAGISGMIKKYEPKVSVWLASDDVGMLQTRLGAIMKNVEDLNAVNEELMPFISDDKVADFFGENAELHFGFEMFINQLRQRLQVVTPSTSQAVAATATVTHQSPPSSSVRLETLKIEPFNGDFLKYQAWWDRFRSRYHENPSISKIDKFEYLIQSLIGVAASAIKNIPPNAANYDEALAIITRRFGRKVPRINAHVTAILELPANGGKGSVAELRNMVDVISANVRSLRAMGALADNSDEVSAVLGPILFSRLTNALRATWYEKNLKEDGINVTDLLEFIESHVEGKELSLMTMKGGEQDSSSSPHSSSSRRAGHKPNPYSDHSHSMSKTTLHTTDGKAPSRPPCPFDQLHHYPGRCEKAQAFSPQEAADLIQKSGRCFRCLNHGHSLRNCTQKGVCPLCQSDRHHHLLCKKRESTGSRVSVHVASTTDAVFLQTVPVKAMSENREADTTVLLDTASESSFINLYLARSLFLPVVRTQRLSIQGFGEVSTGPQDVPVFKVELQSLDRSEPIALEVFGVPAISSKVMTKPKPDTDRFQYLQGIKFPQLSSPKKIGVLLGMDHYHSVVLDGVVRGGAREPVAVNTKFGWILSGPCPQPKPKGEDAIHTQTMFISTEDERIERFIGAESYPDPRSEDDHVYDRFKDTVVHVDGRYQVQLPWKEGHPPLLPNKPQALKRLTRLQSKLPEDLLSRYEGALHEMKSLNFIEEVPEEPPMGPVFYLPHRPVVKESSNTTKVRPVFDGSAKGPTGVSLNECLYKGPSFAPDIPDLLIRFRTHQVATSSDIKKAFLQVQLDPKDRDVCRFLWKEEDVLKEFRFRVVTFGLTSAPFLLTASIQVHLERQPQSPLISEMKHSFYVDNLLMGAPTTEEAYTKALSSCEIMSGAGMKLAQWASNDHSLTSSLKSAGFDVDESPTVKVLGLSWNTEEDTFQVQAVIHPLTLTKRGILSLAAHLYDPLGFVSVVAVRAKLLVQRLWESGFDWDQGIVDPALVTSAELLALELSRVHSLKFPRLISIHPSSTLHIFCDASPVSAVACAYLATKSIGGQLLVSKTKLAPLKVKGDLNPPLQIPRMELVGCLLGARLATRVVAALRGLQLSVHFWTDSTIALWWINEKGQKLPVFVKNRSEEIRRLSAPIQWRHVPSQENPADLPTRGEVPLEELASSTLWQKGPAWLSSDPEEWPPVFLPPSTVEVQLTHTVDVIVETPTSIIDFEKFSSVDRAVRTMSWVRRFIDNCRSAVLTGSRPARQKGPIEAVERIVLEDHFLSTDEKASAELALIRQEQLIHFPEEVKAAQGSKPLDNSPLRRLHVSWDPDRRLLISIGREKPQAPLILLPKYSRLSRLILDRVHQLNFHSGPEMTLARSRSTYWIVHGRVIAKQLIRNCRICRRTWIPHYAQREASLPSDRVMAARPFEVSGCDFAGPLYIKEGGKVYITLFTCAVVRSVHLEIIPDLSCHSFLQALRKFEARRGAVRVMYSDNAKTFRKAKKASFIANRIKWKFIPPRAAWHGGFYERLVRSIKEPLKKTIGKSLMPLRELETLIIEIEGILNDRPLTPVSDQREDDLPLTPNHFIRPSPPDCQLSASTGPGLRKMWAHRQRLLQSWWKRWSQAYLSSLHKWNQQKVGGTATPKIGDLVLIESPGPFNARHRWPLGRIIDLIPSRDHYCRQALVKVQGGTVLRRATRHLYPLEAGPDPEAFGPPTSVLPEDSQVKDILTAPGPAVLPSPFPSVSQQPCTSKQPSVPQVTRRGRTVRLPRRYRTSPDQ